MVNNRNRESGTTLFELLIAIVLVIGVVAIISQLFPKAIRGVEFNRQRITAQNLARAKIEEFKRQPYGTIPATADGSYFPVAATCNCSQVVNYMALPDFDPPIVSGSHKFSRSWCVNYTTVGTGSIYTPQCTYAGDYKNIKVWVWWLDESGNNHVVNMETVQTRL